MRARPAISPLARKLQPRGLRSTQVERPLLLTILSVLAGWSLLSVLAAGLLLILKALDSIRNYLQKITAGVRAIEQQTMPLSTHADTLTASLSETGDALAATARYLAQVDRNLDAAALALRPAHQGGK